MYLVNRVCRAQRIVCSPVAPAHAATSTATTTVSPRTTFLSDTASPHLQTAPSAPKHGQSYVYTRFPQGPDPQGSRGLASGHVPAACSAAARPALTPHRGLRGRKREPKGGLPQNKRPSVAVTTPRQVHAPHRQTSQARRHLLPAPRPAHTTTHTRTTHATFMLSRSTPTREQNNTSIQDGQKPGRW